MKHLIVALTLFTSLAWCQAKPKQSAVKNNGTTIPVSAKSCTAELDEKCPSPEWLASYLKMKKLQEPYTMPQDTQDLVSGIANRLQREVPPGFQWNEEKQRFVKIASSAPAPVPPAPAAAKPETQK